VQCRTELDENGDADALLRPELALSPFPSDPAVMADSADLNLDAPSDLQDIPDMAMELIPPPEGTFPDK